MPREESWWVRQDAQRACRLGTRHSTFRPTGSGRQRGLAEVSRMGWISWPGAPALLRELGWAGATPEASRPDVTAGVGGCDGSREERAGSSRPGAQLMAAVARRHGPGARPRAGQAPPAPRPRPGVPPDRFRDDAMRPRPRGRWTPSWLRGPATTWGGRRITRLQRGSCRPGRAACGGPSPAPSETGSSAPPRLPRRVPRHAAKFTTDKPEDRRLHLEPPSGLRHSRLGLLLGLLFFLKLRVSVSDLLSGT